MPPAASDPLAWSNRHKLKMTDYPASKPPIQAPNNGREPGIPQRPRPALCGEGYMTLPADVFNLMVA